jgi:ribose 5-phosphate isomerase B
MGCTRRGFAGKLDVANFLRQLCHEVDDIGCHDVSTKVEYATLVQSLTAALGHLNGDLAILVGRDGAGMCIAANKLRGLRAAVADDEVTAACVRERYQCNVLCLGAERHGPGGLTRIVESFLAAKAPAGRSAHAVEELLQIEACAGACGVACTSRGQYADPTSPDSRFA